MKKEIQPHQARFIAENGSPDKQFKDLQRSVGVITGGGAEKQFATSPYLDTPPELVAALEGEDARQHNTAEAGAVTDKQLTGVLTGDAESQWWEDTYQFGGNQPTLTLHKGCIIKRTKELRVAIDAVLQDVKAFGKNCQASPCVDATGVGIEAFKDPQEVPANVKLCQRALEDATMRLGMTLKAIGATNPYPESYNPDSTRIEPTADTSPAQLNWGVLAPC